MKSSLFLRQAATHDWPEAGRDSMGGAEWKRHLARGAGASRTFILILFSRWLGCGHRRLGAVHESLDSGRGLEDRTRRARKGLTRQRLTPTDQPPPLYSLCPGTFRRLLSPAPSFLPVYEGLYVGGQRALENLSATVSLRNTSADQPLIVTAVTYFKPVW